MKKFLLLPVMFFSLLSFSQTMNDINIVPQLANIKIENRFAKFKFLMSNSTKVEYMIFPGMSALSEAE